MLNRLSKTILQHPKLVLFSIGLVTALFSYIAFLSPIALSVDFSLEQMFSNNDPKRQVYEDFRSEFSREDDVALLTFSGADVFSLEKMQIISEITESIEFVEGVEAVFSPANAGNEDYFDLEFSKEIWKEKLQALIKHSIYGVLVVSSDGQSGGILIDLEDDVQDQDSRARLFSEIDDIIQSQGSAFEWHEAGIPILRTRYVDLVNHERSIFFPIAFLVVSCILFAVFRQIKGVILPGIAIITTNLWIAGIMALLGISINVISYLTFNLLMIIGCSNAIHLLMKYHESLGLGLNRRDALDRVITHIGGALFLTSFTTAIGFLSLTLTDIRITQEFGFIVGLGVILMFILTIIILPVMLSLIDIPNKYHIDRLIKGGEFKAAERLNTWTISKPKPVIAFTLMIFGFSIYGLTLVDYNISILDDLKPGNSLFQDIHFVDEQFGGTLPIEIVIDSHSENGILNPEILKKLDSLKMDILSIPQVGVALAITDHLKLINEAIGSYTHELPNTQEDALSFLIDYEAGKNLVNSDFSKARISVRVRNITYDESEEIQSKIEAKYNQRFPKDYDLTLTGSTLLALRTNRHLVKNLTTSFIIAFIIIFISMIFLFKSLRLSIISVLPNIIPLMVAGGLMGYLGIKLRPSTAMTFSIALGIAVDDTIHFLARFRREYQQHGQIQEAISTTLQTTGKAIISTTIILSLGFMVLLFSDFVPNYEFGLLATIVLVVALAGSLILLPVLINYIQPKLRFGLDSTTDE